MIGFLIVAVLTFAISGWIASAWRTRQSGREPIVSATLNELQKGWYQVTISVTNKAPHAFTAVILRRVRPRSLRMLAPINSVSTEQGDFQVWSDPAIDRPTKTIPLHVMIGPHQDREGAAAVDCQSQIAAWLFLPKPRGTLTLELSLAGPDERLRRYRLTASSAKEATMVPTK